MTEQQPEGEGEPINQGGNLPEIPVSSGMAISSRRFSSQMMRGNHNERAMSQRQPKSEGEPFCQGDIRICPECRGDKVIEYESAAPMPGVDGPRWVTWRDACGLCGGEGEILVDPIEMEDLPSPCDASTIDALDRSCVRIAEG